MTNAIIVNTMSEQPPQVSKDRRRELKKSAKKSGVNGVHVEQVDPKRNKQEEIKSLKEMLDEASTPEEAREIYVTIGKELISEDQFKELTKRFEPEEPIAAPQAKDVKPADTETMDTTNKPEKISEPPVNQVPTETESEKSNGGIVRVDGEEYPIEDYETAVTPVEEGALRKVLASEINRLDQILQILEKLSSVKNPGEEAGLMIAKGTAPELEPILEEIYRARNKKELLEKYHDETWRKLKTFQKIDSGLDPQYELGQAFNEGSISDSERGRILEAQMAELKSLEEPESLSGEKTSSSAEEDIPSQDVPDLYGFIEQNIKEEGERRTHQRAAKKTERLDEQELRARNKMHRIARMRREGASEEEIDALSTVEEEFQPTPEMLALGQEINGVRAIAIEKFGEAQSFERFSEKAKAALSELQFVLRRMEMLKKALRQAEFAAREEFAQQKENAQRKLGQESKAKIYRLVKRGRGSLFLPLEQLSREEKKMGWQLKDKLKQALANPSVEHKSRIKIHEQKTAIITRFTDYVKEEFAKGELNESQFEDRLRLVDELGVSKNFSEDAATAFAEGRITEEEFKKLQS